MPEGGVRYDGLVTGMWKGARITVDKVYVGVLGEENSKRPGLYRFQGYGSAPNDCIAIDDAMLLTPDGDIDGNGLHSKPAAGSPCLAITAAGGSAWILGFFRPPVVDSESDKPPTLGDAGDASGPLNYVAGDKLMRTSGGAQILWKRGGSLIAQGGDGVQIQWLKDTNTLSQLAQNMNAMADGYKAVRGRVKVGKTDPETVSIEEFCDKTGSAATRVRVSQGHVTADVRRQLTISSITIAGGTTTGTINVRETYYDSGNWVAEGPKYQWGGTGADENAVLGKTLKAMLKDLIGIIKGLQVNTAWGPSAPPIQSTIVALNKLAADYLDTNGGKILSDYIFLTKKAAAPGKFNE